MTERDERRYLIGKRVAVGSDGFVQLVDFMGSDESIVRTARVSTGRGFVSWQPYQRCKLCDRIVLENGEERGATKCVSSRCVWENFPRGDLGILDYMIANRHTSPFEFAEIILYVRVPMDVWRQWIRHRTASVSEYSTRYSPAIDAMATTAPDQWRSQGTGNRQGSGECLPAGAGSPVLRQDPSLATDGALVDFSRTEAPGHWLSRREAALHSFAREVYEDRLALGVAREQARKDLPLSTYTEAFWKVDLHNLMHFLSLRCDKHAQQEIREYANAIKDEFAAKLWPRTLAIFEERVLGAVRLSRAEAQLVRQNILSHGFLGNESEIAALAKKLA